MAGILVIGRNSDVRVFMILVFAVFFVNIADDNSQ